MRSDRLLRGMHKVINHDLADELVALKSVLQFLREEEADRFTKEGREYVQRLHNATQRVCEQVRFLKEMGRLHAVAPKAEPIALSTLARELQGELQQKHPHTAFSFDWDWRTPTIAGEGRSLRLALSELLGVLMGPDARRCDVSALSRSEGDRVEMVFQVAGRNSAWSAQALEKRMEIVLVREWLALSTASLDLTLPADGTARFLISIPNRSSHV